MKRRSRTRHPLEGEARGWLREATATLRRTEARCAAAVAEAAEAVIQCLETGGTVYFCGNGGSAADSQHLATEFAGRFQVERASLAAVALTTNSSAITAIGNDYGYSRVFSRQLEGLGTPGDVLIAISTSGGAESVRRAVATAKRLGMTTIGMTGLRGADFAASCDIALITPHTATSHVQEGHIAMGHAVCLIVERALFGSGEARRPAARGRGGRTASRRTAASSRSSASRRSRSARTGSRRARRPARRSGRSRG